MAESVLQLDELGALVAGRYQVDALLGRGGTATVYRVIDSLTGRKLALKCSLEGRKTKKRKELLEREFNILAQLAHPCIIDVYDYGVDDRVGPYYTMELLDGEDLHHCGKQPWRRACALLRDVASSLAILHSRGLVHRDVSARNVRCTADGRAKLIDFGAMTSTGVAQDVIGTPPFLAPEVLQMQALDPRADLFSLGALAYYLLTGRHAFPARRLSDLRDAWRSPPVPPSRNVPELPAALSALVMQLLTLDRNTRIHSAPEVMSRLCTLADLPLSEQAQVSQAYLTTPTLVGRERELVSVRKRMLSLARGDGAALVIVGVPGSGRSRMLDACALEAKLVGAQVVRASANHEKHDWDVTRTLGAQLMTLLPDQARDAARLSNDVISQVIPGLRNDPDEVSSAVSADRNLLIRELRDFILALASMQRLVIVVDDADRIDEPSAALLAALAHKTERHSLMVVAAVDRDGKAASTPSLRLLHLVAIPLELAQLSAEQTETLMRSVFGAVPNLPFISAKIHALSQGNPRAIMELFQHLVDRNLAHYRAGTWSLPDTLSERDLPGSLAASLQARLSRLSSDARAICEVLCLADADEGVLAFDDIAKLSTQGDAKRAFQAFDELVSARVLITDVTHYRFSQRGFLAVVESAIAPERTRSIRSQLADALAANGGRLVRRIDHLLAAERDAEALQLLQSMDLAEHPPPIALLERAIDRAVQLNAPARSVHQLRRAVLIKAMPAMACDSYLRHAGTVLAQLVKDSGYDRYQKLGAAFPADKDASQRLTQALTETVAEYERTPEHARVYAAQEAIQELAIFSMASRAMGVLMLDMEFVESLPTLEPFAALSPALELVAIAGEGTTEWLRGRFNGAHALFGQVLARLEAPDRAGLSGADHTRMRLSMHYGIGVLDASRGVATAEAHADALEQNRTYRVNAWRVRRLWHLSRGDLEEASRCQRRAELLLLQDGSEQAYAGTSVLSELITCALSGDVLGIQEAMDAIATHASTLPGWRPFIAYGRASCQRLQGDLQGALVTLLPALDAAPAGRHPAFGFLASVHVGLLCALERPEEAVSRGLAYVEISEREALSTTGQVLHVATAEALALVGRVEDARCMLDDAIEVARAREQTGVSIGTIYEARARLAMRVLDRMSFQHFAELCAAEYRLGNSPFLAANLARLLESAQDDHTLPPPAATQWKSVRAQPVDGEYLTIQSRMLECIDEYDRARTALTLLLQSVESFTGCLFGLNPGKPQLLAALPEDDSWTTEITGWLERYLAAELSRPELEQTLSVIDEPMSHFQARDGRCFEPFLLIGAVDGADVVAAVFVCLADSSFMRHPHQQLRQQVAAQLLEHGDVTGALLKEAGYTETRRR